MAQRRTIPKTKFRMVKVEGHPDRRLFISQTVFGTMIQIPPPPTGRQAPPFAKGGEENYYLSLFYSPIYPLTPTIQTPPKWRGYIGLFFNFYT